MFLENCRFHRRNRAFSFDFEVTDKGIVPCCGDGDTVLVGGERGDVDGVVRAVDLGGQRHVPVIDRLNHHIIISGIACPNNDNLLCNIVIIHLRLNCRSRVFPVAMGCSSFMDDDGLSSSLYTKAGSSNKKQYEMINLFIMF